MLLMLPLLLLALQAGIAHGGPFTTKTSMGNWPDKQVQRDMVLPRGWLQLELAADTKGTSSYRDENGALQPYDEGTTWRYSRLSLNVDQGFSQYVRIYAHIPFVMASLRNDLGAEAQTAALGDVHTGLWFQPWLQRVWATALQVDLKAPSGVEWPGDLIGGPLNTSGFLTGTGITNLGFLLHLKLRANTWGAARLSVGHTFKFPSVVGYVIEDGGFGNGWLDPGDETRAALELMVQPTDDLAISLDGSMSLRGTYRIGNSGPSASELVLDDIADSAGAFTDVGAAISYEAGAHMEARLRAAYQVAGSDTRTFAQLGLEEFSPQPGLTLALSGVVRW